MLTPKRQTDLNVNEQVFQEEKKNARKQREKTYL